MPHFYILGEKDMKAKKQTVAVALVFVLAFSMLALFGCNTEKPMETEIKIEFYSDGALYHTEAFKLGDTPSLPTAPTKDGYTFDGWYHDNGEWENSLEILSVTESIKVYAKFTENTQAIHIHKMTHTQEKAATCKAEGNIEHWTCSDCGKIFADEKGDVEIVYTVTPITEHSFTIDEYKAPTCTALGMSEGRSCSVCGLVVTLQIPLKKLAHDFGEDGSCAVCREYNAEVLLSYELSADGKGYAVIGIGDVTGDSITIPSIYKGLPVVSIAPGAFRNNEILKKINFYANSNLSTIDNNAFANCTNLISIDLPASVKSISTGAFTGCISVESINVASGNKEYTSSGNCLIRKSEKSVILGCKNSLIPTDGSVTRIGSYAFADCIDLISIKIPDGVTSIHKHAFSGCRSLENVEFPLTLVYIGDNAFSGCRSLLKIKIPPNLSYIGDEAFYACIYLVEVYNSSSLTITKGGMDNGDVGVHALAVYTDESESSKLYKTDDGYTLFDDGESLYIVKYDNCASETVFSLPDSINGKSYIVNDYAFLGLADLETLKISSGVKEIRYGAFNGSYNLSSIELLKNSQLTFISEKAFGSDSALSAVYISSIEDWLKINFDEDYDANPLYIAEDLYLNGELLKELVIPNTVSEIKDHAFAGCRSIVSVKIPTGVETIGKGAFSYCTSIISVELPQSMTNIGSGAFWGCEKLVEICNNSPLEIGEPGSFESSLNGNIGDYAINIYTSERGSSKLHETTDGYVFMQDGSRMYLVAYIGDETEIVLPYKYDNSTEYSIYKYAFTHCADLKSVTIPASVTGIGEYAFSYCANIESVTISTSIAMQSKLTSIGDHAFEYCTSLKSIEIPQIVTSIGASAFAYCRSLESIEIPQSVTSIGAGAFAYCRSLESIEIPQSVTSIGDIAFLDCTVLTIYAEVGSKPDGWSQYWNSSNCTVIWDYKNK